MIVTEYRARHCALCGISRCRGHFLLHGVLVWSAAGAMDLENQKRVKDLTEEHGAENIVVLLGAAEGEASGIAAETVTAVTRPMQISLTGVSLGLVVYHVCEDEVKEEFDRMSTTSKVSMMEMVLDIDEIAEEMQAIREEYTQY